MKYTKDDKVCSHCGGNVSAHCDEVQIIYWCDVCGSNNKEAPPSINVELSTPKVKEGK